MESVQAIKQRFGIIGNDLNLNHAIEKAVQVAPTDISVLITGESGVGKESIPKIIHALSHRKHGKLIAVNCGAIPEGTIDSELFGHEKGAFTGATSTRSGYFEEADGGTIFLDEVGELPLTTQVRLLRVLENGEFMKVGSSKVQKTDARVVAATNVKMLEAIKKNKFREDLYYRLSTIEINLPPLRQRNGDIHLLFRKFASDFATKYQMPTVRLTKDAIELLNKYHWQGNIRQLRNCTEQISILEKDRMINSSNLEKYLPENQKQLPTVIDANNKESDFKNEREILYKVLFDMKSDLNDLKQLTLELIKNGNTQQVHKDHEGLINKIYGNATTDTTNNPQHSPIEKLPYPQTKVSQVSNTEDEYIEIMDSEITPEAHANKYHYIEEVEEEETLSLHDKELELIRKSLERHNNKRKAAAEELGISERTLYRKIKQFNL